MDVTSCLHAALADPTCANVVSSNGDTCACVYASSNDVNEDGCVRRELTGWRVYICPSDPHASTMQSIETPTVSSAPTMTYADPKIDCVTSTSVANACFDRVAGTDDVPGDSCEYFHPTSCPRTRPEGDWPDLEWCKWAEATQHQWSDPFECVADCDASERTALDRLLDLCQYKQRCETMLTDETPRSACDFCAHSSCVVSASKLKAWGFLDDAETTELLDKCLTGRCFQSVEYQGATAFVGGRDTTIDASVTAARDVAIAVLSNDVLVSYVPTRARSLALSLDLSSKNKPSCLPVRVARHADATAPRRDRASAS